MAELVDALDSGSSRGNSVDVRVILAAKRSKAMSKIDQISVNLLAGTNAIALVANGAIHHYPTIANEIKKYPTVIAVDGGLVYCHEMGIMPNYLIGDLDSAPEELVKSYSHIPVQRFNVEKDESDLELAISFALTHNPERIAIFGALEKRMDQTLMNLHLARRHPKRIFLETEEEHLFALTGFNELHCDPGQRLSLISLGLPAIGVTTQGLKWELSEATVDRDFMSLSNICQQEKIRISIKSGDLICCLSKGQAV